jgi:hypothetical protein
MRQSTSGKLRYGVLVSATALEFLVAGCGVAQDRRETNPANANALIATLPFAANGGTSIFLSVQLNGGLAGWWVLDSGASDCIVDRATARRAALDTRGSREIHGTGKGTARLDTIRSAVRLSINDRALATCDHFGAIDLSGLATNGYRAIAGILGYEFFARYIVRIDFAAHTVQLYDPAKFRYAGNGDTLALEFVGRQPRVEVHIRTARRPEVVRHLIVDTGSEDAVDDSTVRRSAKGSGITVSTTGLGSSYEAAIGTLDTVRIGRTQLTNIPGVASDVGIVGNGIWSRFVCVFDYSYRRLFLESR